jgi:hypothetical protein
VEIPSPQEFTYVLTEQPNGLWSAHAEEFMGGPAVTDQPTPLKALQECRSWMDCVSRAAAKSAHVFTPTRHTRFLLGQTQLTCGCTGRQVHAFLGAPNKVFVARDRSLWFRAAEVDAMPEVDTVLGITLATADMPLSTPRNTVYAWHSGELAWHPDERTMPTIVHTRACVVCSCIQHIDGEKHRRCVQASQVPEHKGIPNPFTILRPRVTHATP